MYAVLKWMWLNRITIMSEQVTRNWSEMKVRNEGQKLGQKWRSIVAILIWHFECYLVNEYEYLAMSIFFLKFEK
jgi:hypothetical protein